ncbi:hypothetical protein BFR44_03060 [Brochothrix thermosphacta]|nr:hypothetical protein BFR44_03060 [Brochothrix thermosphacta]
MGADVVAYKDSMGADVVRSYELTKTVWVLTLLRNYELTKTVWVLTLLRNYELTKTVWDGATASTTPYIDVPLLC